VEYKKDFDAHIYVQPTPVGLVISAVNGQRFYTNNKWPNTVVLKIENVQYKPQNDHSTRAELDGAK